MQILNPDESIKLYFILGRVNSIHIPTTCTPMYKAQKRYYFLSVLLFPKTCLIQTHDERLVYNEICNSVWMFRGGTRQRREKEGGKHRRMNYRSILEILHKSLPMLPG